MVWRLFAKGPVGGVEASCLVRSQIWRDTTIPNAAGRMVLSEQLVTAVAADAAGLAAESTIWLNSCSSVASRSSDRSLQPEPGRRLQ